MKKVYTIKFELLSNINFGLQQFPHRNRSNITESKVIDADEEEP